MSQVDQAIFARNPQRYVPWLILVAAFLVYVATLSQRLDRNSLYELMVIEHGSATELLRPNHMLFRPLARGFYNLWQFFGYEGRALLPAQLLVAFTGAAAVAILWVILVEIGSDRRLAAWLTLAYASGYACWYWSTNVHYMLPAVSSACAAFLLMLRLRRIPPTPVRLVGMSLLTALAIAFWQANVFIVAPLSYGILFLPQAVSISQRRQALLIWGGLTLALVAGLYLIVGTQVYGVDSLSSLRSWLTTYPAKMTVYGQMDPHRVVPTFISAVAAILPVWEGLGLRALLRGELILQKIIPQVSR